MSEMHKASKELTSLFREVLKTKPISSHVQTTLLMIFALAIAYTMLLVVQAAIILAIFAWLLPK